METLASVWAGDPRDLSDLGQKRQEPLSVWGETNVLRESQCGFSRSPPAGQMWSEQLSPHLQRNKQLQDTLLQREEELVRLQEENNKLREFLSSSFVRDLEQTAKKLTAHGRRKLKRNLMQIHDGPFQNCSHPLQSSQQVSKRVCRNLNAEFCSEFSETSASSSEPNLDLWVLRTLGLKDRDTIDISNNDPSSSPQYNLSSLVYDAAVTSSSSSESTLTSPFSPPLAASTPSSVNNYCQCLTYQTDCRYEATECQGANCWRLVESPQNCTTSPRQCSDFTATGLIRQCEAPEAASYNTLTAFQSGPLTAEQAFTQSPDRAEICSITALSQAQTLEGNQAKRPAYSSTLRGSWASSQDRIHFSPRSERASFPPNLSSSSPVMNPLWVPVCSPVRPSAGCQPPATPETLCSRTDLAFSMSLSPSSSVKTHSFPQGQAFIRKDPEGKWNFTWVPRQGS